MASWSGSAGLPVQPRRDRPPLRGLVAVPAVGVREHHLDELDARGLESIEGAFERDELVGLEPTGDHGLVGRRLDPVRLADQDPAVSTDRRAEQVDGPGEAAADPRRPDARDDVEGTRIGLVRAGVALDEGQAIGDAELGSPRDRRTEEDRAQVDADARPNRTTRPIDRASRPCRTRDPARASRPRRPQISPSSRSFSSVNGLRMR